MLKTHTVNNCPQIPRKAILRVIRTQCSLHFPYPPPRYAMQVALNPGHNWS